ncbi:holo-[acyl-carrier protein] synthase [Limnobacter thiooxidans]|uniref:Holo-[acyl-carrier-protein] synthase n=1 Tax=Limnobacter thiooxidans TaxID=131080 RepID=A0AA86IYT3_9BURK|nr:holo-ACP synthase [Limnobacter sp.]MCZ8015436.1 holo-ACP synthase [Limnobacter sp.]RZS42521.1 holo-[acyl-carrier protein] synthase [Limnobacter thiooxidans]BET26044.1 holo-ACP synthase [Limnobacter thiooxidans]
MIDDVFGLGCDILELARLDGLLGNDKARFVKRVLTVQEQAEFENRSAKSDNRGRLYVATRFCAKEAFSKAMGTGIGAQFSFQDLSVLNDELGRPLLSYSERLSGWLESRRAFAKVSISDEQHYVMSTVILYSKTII